MILEGLVTTLDASGQVNIAPMGPIVDHAMSRLVLRPFQTSQTYRNLKVHPSGVFHVTDDVELIARAALDRLQAAPETFAAERVSGRVLSSACRWYEFQVVSLDDSRERTEITVDVVHRGHLRDVFGFNRAMHAVLEATIVATRLHLLAEADVRTELMRLQSPVEKTAGPRELAAWRLVVDFVDDWYRQGSAGRVS